MKGYEYVLLQPGHGTVGVGPTEDREAVEQDQRDWEKDTGIRGEILRREIAEWEVDPESIKTRSNPNGETRQCDQRHLHSSHEWQAEFGAYFNVYCPGNVGIIP